MLLDAETIVADGNATRLGLSFMLKCKPSYASMSTRCCSRPSIMHSAMHTRRGLATEASKVYTANGRPPDVLSQPYPLPVVKAEDRRVSVQWKGHPSSRFHSIWLRDHCRCPHCFHPITKQRMVDTFTIPADIQPLSVNSTAAGLQVTWSGAEEHVSVYPWPWLERSSYDPPFASARMASAQKPALWGKRIGQGRPTAHFGEVMHDEIAVLDWLRKVDRFGVCFVEGVPPTTEATAALSRRISHIRETQYGSLWSFTSDLAHGDTAYTNIALPAHTDTTYYTDPCGLQVFHLLSHTQGTGGESLLVDGFYAASLLQRLHPKSYDLLSRVAIPSHSAGDDENLYHPMPLSGYPVLGRDHVTGELLSIRWNNNDRSVMSTIDPHIVDEWYTAIRDWNSCLTRPDAELWVQLQPGTAVVINNHRVLHGRAAFTGRRQLCGAYIGWDDFQSRLRVLEERQRLNQRNGDSARHTAGAESAAMDGRSVWDPAL